MKNKVNAGIILYIFISCFLHLNVAAGTWQQTGGRWWYKEGDSYSRNGWKWIDGDSDGYAECYYFDSAGWLLTDTITPDNYNVNSSGAWIIGMDVQSMKIIPGVLRYYSRDKAYETDIKSYMESETLFDIRDWVSADSEFAVLESDPPNYLYVVAGDNDYREFKYIDIIDLPQASLNGHIYEGVVNYKRGRYHDLWKKYENQEVDILISPEGFIQTYTGDPHPRWDNSKYGYGFISGSDEYELSEITIHPRYGTY